MRPERGILPGLCASVARGVVLPARTLSRVEDFAATIWLVQISADDAVQSLVY